MKNKIIDCIGKIDDEIIMEAETYKKEKHSFKRSYKLILTFVCVLVLAVIVVNPFKLNEDKLMSTSESMDNGVMEDAAEVTYYQVKVRVDHSEKDGMVCEVLESDNEDIHSGDMVIVVSDEPLDINRIMIIDYYDYDMEDMIIIYGGEIYEEN